ncbi:DUF3300 domain-containing protein [Kluyvera sp. CHPC 1.2972]|uniref:DUF3300 domain-containing protein n=1 Tax=Kluyvera sp. CHPC 1.2972 TaxID=2995176 RepID=UPI002FD7A4E5
MTLPFKPHYIALICSAGLLAAAGTLYVKSREPVPPDAPPAVTAAVPEAAPAPVTYTTAQITQWVAPIALYPDPLLSQVLMASTYPDNVTQAVQWSKDHPGQQGDAAVKAVANQPWDASVKSLVAFPQLTGMMGEDPQWVTNLGNAFLAQPQDVMDAVQKLRQLAQQTGSLKSTPQQTVTTTKRVASSTSTHAVSSTPTVIKIEPSNPQVVYVPNYNPTVVYGSSWPYTSAPPVYLPPPPGEQFADSFVRGFGYSLGVATTYAIFSNIDWDDDDHHHHDDDHHDDHHDDHYDHGGYQHNGDNININVNNFNKISGQNISGQTMGWQHNPAYRGNTPYPNNSVAQQFHPTNVAGGLSATHQTPGVVTPHQTEAVGGLSATQHVQPNRDSQRQAAMSQLQQRTHTGSGNASPAALSSRDAQRNAATQKWNQAAQRNNFRGYDAPTNRTQTHPVQQHAAATQHTQQRPQLNATQRQNLQTHERLNGQTPHLNAGMMGQNSALRANGGGLHNTALSGNESRAPSWQAQQSRGLQSRHASGLGGEQHIGSPAGHHEFRRR